MTVQYGHMGGRLLDVDLTGGRIVCRTLAPELLELYQGGRGLGARLLYDNLEPGVEALSPGNLLLFMTGPLVGSGAPLSTRFVVVTKSPATGGIANAACGGDLGVKLKQAGYDALLVRGRAERPSYIEVTDESVAIRDATDLWGLGTYETQKRLPKRAGKAVIGPAGENRVRIAAIISGERAAARSGVGAVMGSKHLKAVIASGKQKVAIADPEGFKAYRKTYVDIFKKHPAEGDILPRLGTAHILMNTSGTQTLPTRNFQRGTDPKAYAISGEKLAEEDLVKSDGCSGCIVRCGRVVPLESQEGRPVKGPEYETLALLGANVGCFDLKRIYETNYACDDLGLDTISAGNVLGFVMELTEKGLLESDLAFDRTDNLVEALHDIAHRRGLGDEMAEGVKRLAHKYGGEAFAMHVKGLELPGYDPRGCWGQGLEYASANRGGDHVQGSTMYLEATGPLKLDPTTTKNKHHFVVAQQNTAAAIGSLVMCVFTSFALVPPKVYRMSPHSLAYRLLCKVALAAGPLLSKAPPPIVMLWYANFMTRLKGERFTFRDFFLLGERTFNMERLFNLREGLSAKDDTLPERLLKEPIAKGLPEGVPVHAMLPAYYRTRGWDAEGRPSAAKLASLGIRTERRPFEIEAGEPVTSAA